MEDKKCIWAYAFRDWHPWTLGSIVSGPEVRQNTMGVMW